MEEKTEQDTGRMPDGRGSRKKRAGGGGRKIWCIMIDEDLCLTSLSIITGLFKLGFVVQKARTKTPSR